MIKDERAEIMPDLCILCGKCMQVCPQSAKTLVRIEVDGSCNAATFQELRQAGVEVFIVGNSGLFQLDDNLHAAWEKMLAQFHGEIDKTQHLRKQP